MTDETGSVTTGINEAAISELAAMQAQIDEHIPTEAVALRVMIGKVKPIMRLIDEPVYEKDWYHSTRNGGYDKQKVHGRGICIYEDVKSTGDDRGDYKGTEIYLMRDGSLELADVKGEWSEWQEECSGKNRDFDQISAEKALEYEDIETFIYNMNRAIQKAQKASAGKMKMLARRKEIVSRIIE